MPGLQGRTIAITRGEGGAREFACLVEAEGGRAIAVPAVEIVPAGQAAAEEFASLLKKKRHDYCAFMSAQAARVLFELLPQAGDLLKETEVIAVGPKTKEELETRGVRATTPDSEYSSEGVVKMLAAAAATTAAVGAKKERSKKKKKIIIPRSGEANEYAAEALSGLGMEVDEVLMYTVRTASVTPALRGLYSMVAGGKVDAIVFTSASNVRAFFEIMGKLGLARPACELISIGPFTSAELQKRGLECHEAGEHTIRGTVEAAKALFMEKGRRPQA